MSDLPKSTGRGASRSPANRLLLDASAALDPEGRVVDASASLLQWLGMNQSELIGKSFPDEFAKLRPEWQSPLEKLFRKSNAAADGELRLDSGAAQESVQVRRIACQAGCYLHFRSLRPAIDLKAEMLGRAASGLRHDFNNLMTAIFGLTEGLQLQTAEGESIAEGLGYIRENTVRARQLVERILDLYQPRPTEQQYYDAVEQAAEAIDLANKLLTPRIKLEWTTDASKMPVLLDRVSFREAVLELVSRMAAWVPEKGRLKAEITEQNPAAVGPPLVGRMPQGPVIILTVSLKGVALPGAVLAEAFQLSPSSQPAAGALSAVQKFIEAHSGALVIQSSAGFPAVCLVIPRAEL